jgi:hypothetical protein
MEVYSYFTSACRFYFYQVEVVAQVKAQKSTTSLTYKFRLHLQYQIKIASKKKSILKEKSKNIDPILIYIDGKKQQKSWIVLILIQSNR